MTATSAPLPVEPLVLEPVLTRPNGWPEHSLAREIAEWTQKYLLQPDGDKAGQPWAWTEEQQHFLSWFYAVDGDGRWLYPRAVLERAKGAGKDPIAAALALVELAGPCRFSHWAGNGVPAGRRHPAALVQIAAVAKDQTRSTLSLFPPMVSPKLIAEAGLDIGKEIIYAKTLNGRLEAVTSSPLALEGPRPTLAILNEAQNWFKSNQGHAMREVIDRNIAKARGGGARQLFIGNAYEPGMDSVAEQMHEAYLQMDSGKSKGRGLLYDSREAPPLTDLSDRSILKAGLAAAYGDATWVDLDGIADLIHSPQTRPSVARRYYLNQKVAPEDAWTDRQLWDANKVDDVIGAGGEIIPVRLMARDEITLGFDGSRTDDATALVACRTSDGLLQPIGIWEIDSKVDGDEINREDVVERVVATFATYRVAGFYADVQEWESYVDQWSRDFGGKLKLKASPRSAVGWDMRQRGQQLTAAVEGMETAIRDLSCPHTGDRVMRQHVLNARRRSNQWGVSFGKEHRGSQRKVDALAAAVLARMARNDLYAKGKARHGGSAVVMGW